MTPLQIDCRLAGPWVPPSLGFNLDGLVAHALVNRHVRAADTSINDYDQIISDLPFDKHENGVWKASVFHPVGWLGQERRCLVGKTDTQHMSILIAQGTVEAKGGSTIDTVRGIAKNAQVFFTIEHAQGMRAWCIGDADAITDLLADVTSIGVKTRMGFGALLEYPDGSYWRIQECDEAQLHWMRRSSPTQLIAESYPAIGSWKPPYWRGSEPIFRPIPDRLDMEASHQENATPHQPDHDPLAVLG